MSSLATVYSFDEDSSGGRPSGPQFLDPASSGGLTVPTAAGSRRESFLYRSDSEFDVSPKSVSRHSSIGSSES